MRMMGMRQFHSAADDLVPQLARPVDAHMAAFVGVIFVGKQPAHPLGQPSRDRDRQCATHFEDPDQLGDGGVVLRDVFEDFGGDDAVKCPVGVRQPQRVTENHPRRRRRGRLSRLGHRTQDGVDGPQFGCIAVEGDNVGTAPVGLERMPAGAAPDVNDLGGRPDTEPVKIDRQHRAIARS